jgi:hypothetical protein
MAWVIVRLVLGAWDGKKSINQMDEANGELLSCWQIDKLKFKMQRQWNGEDVGAPGKIIDG